MLTPSGLYQVVPSMAGEGQYVTGERKCVAGGGEYVAGEGVCGRRGGVWGR